MKRKVFLLFLALITVLTVMPISGCSNGNENKILVRSLDDLHDCRIGVETGSSFDKLVKQTFPDCPLDYYLSNFELMTALNIGRVAAFVCDEPIAEQMILEKPSYRILAKLASEFYGFAYAKNSERALTLRNQMNDFLEKAAQDGTLEDVREIWFGTDEKKKTIDIDSLTGENGTLKMGVSSVGMAPFVYVENGKIIGYEVDLVARFCREYGYKLDITDYDFTGLLAAVASEKVDLGASCITITEERKESFDFSSPYYEGGAVVVVKNPTPIYSSIEELADKRVGVVTGSSFAELALKRFPDAQLVYLDSVADTVAALNTDKIDYYLIDDPIGRVIIAQNPNHSFVGTIVEDQYGIIFRKDDENGAALCRQMNEFIARIKADGTFDQITNTWFDNFATAQPVDYESLPADNGTLKCAVSTAVGAPFVSVKDGKFIGYEVAFVTEFCQEYGYGIEFTDFSLAGMLTAVTLGKCDFGTSGISITEERKESVLFSDPTYCGGIVAMVKNDFDGGSKTSFFASIADNFYKTFIRENRWKMFLSGTGVTLLITAISAILGSLIGFAFFLIYRKNIKPVVAFFDIVSNVLERMPIIVILMILYYVIFGKSDISGIIVSTMGFTILFSFGVLGLLKAGVLAVDKGQSEAALALGYTDSRAFLRIIFPQSVKHFMPGYKSALVSLIKDTSIVGYIAVQDLTKVSDIVRSRTYEPFFPLIATAVIYFLLAIVLISIVKRVEIGVDPRYRKAEKILKGVKTK